MMQTRKAHARWLPGGDPQVHRMWEVTHPDTTVSFWSSRPDAAARELIERYVLTNQTELVLK